LTRRAKPRRPFTALPEVMHRWHPKDVPAPPESGVVETIPKPRGFDPAEVHRETIATFRKLGEVDTGDKLVACRGERRIAG
jgi:hypothetical protein